MPWNDNIYVFVNCEESPLLKEACEREMGEEYYYQSRNNHIKNFIYWDRIGHKNTTSIDKSLKTIKADWWICIDIFPLMHVSDIKEEQQKQISNFRKSQIMCLKYLNRATYKDAKGIDKLKKIISTYIPERINYKLYKRYLNKGSEKKNHMNYYNKIPEGKDRENHSDNKNVIISLTKPYEEFLQNK